MKLHYSPTSPFVRKVAVAAQEKGLSDRIELVPTNPHAGGELKVNNPLEKVPCLVADDGTALYDSFVICSHLDGLGAGAKLVPDKAEARMDVLRRHALADGIMEAAVLCVMEARRPEDKRWADATARQRAKIERAIDALEGETGAMGNDVNLSTIAVGCALGYVDFRLSDLDWRKGHPKLAAWYEAFARRPSMMGSAPKDPA